MEGKGTTARTLSGKKYSSRIRSVFSHSHCTNRVGGGDIKTAVPSRINPDMQSELACRDEGRTLDQFSELAIRSRRCKRFTSPLSQTNQPIDGTEPTQVGQTHLTAEEREHHIRNHPCLYCGQAGHMRADCLTRSHQTHNCRVSVLIYSIQEYFMA